MSLLLYFKPLSSERLFPLELDPMATVGDLLKAAQQACHLQSLPQVSHADTKLSDPQAMLADLGICPESTVCQCDDLKHRFKEVCKRFGVQEDSTTMALHCAADSVPHKLARAGEADDLRAVLHMNKHLDLEHEDSYGSTPLMDAVAAGQIDTVRVLIYDGKVNVNHVDREGTPLHQAVTQGFPDMVRVLLEEGKADGSLRDEQNRLPATLAKTRATGAYTDDDRRPDFQRCLAVLTEFGFPPN
eukprot:Hpha_TRINITY_DN18839_c0_g1::TRINITY_DN18839_c0_g1_i1::g.26225::m.26225